MLPIFVFMSVVLLGGAALLTDVAWWWTNELRMRSAADAAALAGAIWLPDDPVRAEQVAKTEAAKNGYQNGVGGVTVKPHQDTENPSKLVVDIAGPVETHFARVFCWQGGPCLDRVNISVAGSAEFTMAVPMGSPENYYGVFGMTRGLTKTAEVDETDVGWSCTTASTSDDEGYWPPPAGTPISNGCTARLPNTSSGGSWSASSGTTSNSLTSNNDSYAQTDLNGNEDAHTWQVTGSTNGLQAGIPNPAPGDTLAIVGLQVRLQDAFISAACTGAGNTATIGVDLSWGGGVAGTWSTEILVPSTGSLPTDRSSGDYVIGSVNSTAPWGAHTWTRSDLSSSNFRIRLTGRENCTNNLQFRVDMVDIRVKWQHDHTSVVTEDVPDQPLKGPGRACDNSKAACFEADGEDLEERGFWATLNTQGSENVNGDAYQPYYDTRTNGVSPVCPQRDRACYDPTTFYNYIIEMPPGATNGKVYVYDPQFCAVVENKGTGDRWFGGGNPISTYYALYDTKTSLLDFVEDQPALVSSGSTFRLMDFTDTDMDGSGGGLECTYRNDMLYGDGRDWHNRWYLLNPLSEDQMVGGDDGKLYRIHTTSTNLSNASEQSNANGENSFAIYVSAENTGGVTPRVYGLGAMQAFTPLTSNSSIDNNWADDVLSEFYLAQIEAAHAGKIMEISLWDPGTRKACARNCKSFGPTRQRPQAGPRQRSPTRRTRGPAMRTARTATRFLTARPPRC